MIYILYMYYTYMIYVNMSLFFKSMRQEVPRSRSHGQAQGDDGAIPARCERALAFGMSFK